MRQRELHEKLSYSFMTQERGLLLALGWLEIANEELQSDGGWESADRKGEATSRAWERKREEKNKTDSSLYLAGAYRRACPIATAPNCEAP